MWSHKCLVYVKCQNIQFYSKIRVVLTTDIFFLLMRDIKWLFTTPKAIICGSWGDTFFIKKRFHIRVKPFPFLGKQISVKGITVLPWNHHRNKNLVTCEKYRYCTRQLIVSEKQSKDQMKTNTNVCSISPSETCRWNCCLVQTVFHCWFPTVSDFSIIIVYT